jgi:hypothetical protein
MFEFRSRQKVLIFAYPGSEEAGYKQPPDPKVSQVVHWTLIHPGVRGAHGQMLGGKCWDWDCKEHLEPNQISVGSLLPNRSESWRVHTWACRLRSHDVASPIERMTLASVLDPTLHSDHSNVNP